MMVYSSRVLSEVGVEGWLKGLIRLKVLQKPLWLRFILNPYLRSTFVSIGRYFCQVESFDLVLLF